ncbi:MAG TPA: outer membrane beta-barrel protein [Longimicrobiales bacterium]|nr:outer membrane beta-barrel protein [Longimicrobiales bacterium]
MRTHPWLVAGMIGGLTIAVPMNSQAQERDEDSIQLGSNWNLFLHGGLTTHGRFALQRPGIGGERALRTEDGFNIGGGVGVNIMSRMGLRLSYTAGSSDLVFRTDNGDESENLDLDNVGTLQSHVAAIEIVRYVLRSSATINPYGSAGFVGTWWVLDEESQFVAPAGGDTQFRLGAIASLGLQARLTDDLDLRVEAASGSIRNPFTGRDSFRALGGTTIEEPTRVNKTDFRLVGVYNFGRSARDRAANR